jgi:hypothetical protein
MIASHQDALLRPVLKFTIRATLEVSSTREVSPGNHQPEYILAIVSEPGSPDGLLTEIYFWKRLLGTPTKEQ